MKPRKRHSIFFRIFKGLVDFFIVIYLILLVLVIMNGQVQIALGDVSIKAHHLYTPIRFLIPLIILRLLITLRIKNFFLLLGSVSFCLLTLEAMLRIWNPPIARPEMIQIHQASPFFGWDLVPGTSGTGFMGESYQINSKGFRDIERSMDRQPGKSRIMVIGDSFTFGARVNGEATYPSQLEKVLNSRGIPSEVINCGVIGHNMWQHYEVLKRKALSFHPDLVVLALFVDDLAAPSSPKKGSGDYHGTNPFRDREFFGMLDHIYLWNVLKNTNAVYEYKYRYRQGHSYMKTIEDRKREWGPANPGNLNYRIMSGKIKEKRLDAFSEKLREFVRLANGEGVKVLVALIPDSVQLNEPDLQVVNRTIERICRKMGVPFVDLTPFLESEKNHSALYLFPFDAHNSPEGLRLIAKTLADQIEGGNLLKLTTTR